MIDILFYDDSMEYMLAASNSTPSACISSTIAVIDTINRLNLPSKHFQFLYSDFSPRSNAMPVLSDVLRFWRGMWLSSTFVISLQGFRDALCKRVLGAKCNARQMQRKKVMCLEARSGLQIPPHETAPSHLSLLTRTLLLIRLFSFRDVRLNLKMGPAPVVPYSWL